MMRETATTRTWEDARSTYRQDFDRRYGATGARWEEAEPGYRYGHAVAADARYQGRSWDEIELPLRTAYTSWAQQQGYRPEEVDWDRQRRYVRDAWEASRRPAETREEAPRQRVTVRRPPTKLLVPTVVGGVGVGAVLWRRRQRANETVIEKGRQRPWLLLSALGAALGAAVGFVLVRTLRNRNRTDGTGGQEQAGQEPDTGRRPVLEKTRAAVSGATQRTKTLLGKTPIGSIGGRSGASGQRVRDVMTPNPATVEADTDVATAATQMRALNVGVLPVLAGGQLVGVITDRDLALAMAEGNRPPGSVRVREHMSTAPVTVSPDTPVNEAAQLMAQHQVRRLPVVEGTRLVGIIALGDVATSGADAAAATALEEISQPAEPQR